MAESVFLNVSDYLYFTMSYGSLFELIMILHPKITILSLPSKTFHSSSTGIPLSLLLRFFLTSPLFETDLSFHYSRTLNCSVE